MQIVLTIIFYLKDHEDQVIAGAMEVQIIFFFMFFLN